jgi:hypothetical protein
MRYRTRKPLRLVATASKALGDFSRASCRLIQLSAALRVEKVSTKFIAVAPCLFLRIWARKLGLPLALVRSVIVPMVHPVPVLSCDERKI